MNANEDTYVGRFAPSPTGPLHFGSLIAALASFLDAKSRQGQWKVRIEDIDPPREVPGAAELILASLRAHGLHWDDETWWQHSRQQTYASALAQLTRAGMCFPCHCSRTTLLRTGGLHTEPCPERRPLERSESAQRVRVTTGIIEFHDLIQGPQSQRLDQVAGDFVVRRKDGQTAYQLAVVIDDAAQGINHVVRGADLLSSTARQIYLQRLLDLPTPRYGHFPVVADHSGQKLSKQSGAIAIDIRKPIDNLMAALRFLQQPIPTARMEQPQDLLNWSIERWDRARIPATDILIDPAI